MSALLEQAGVTDGFGELFGEIFQRVDRQQLPAQLPGCLPRRSLDAEDREALDLALRAALAAQCEVLPGDDRDRILRAVVARGRPIVHWHLTASLVWDAFAPQTGGRTRALARCLVPAVPAPRVVTVSYRQVVGAVAELRAWSRRNAPQATFDGRISCREAFIQRLERGTRFAVRTGCPLSLAVVRVAISGEADEASVRQRAMTLVAHTIERLAISPNAPGAQEFQERVTAGAYALMLRGTRPARARALVSDVARALTERGGLVGGWRVRFAIAISVAGYEPEYSAESEARLLSRMITALPSPDEGG